MAQESNTEFYWVYEGKRYPAGVYFKSRHLQLPINAWIELPDGDRVAFNLTADYRKSPECAAPLIFAKDPFGKVKIDDKGYFFNGGVGGKVAGHFAGTDSNNKPMAWAGGRTSFTSNCEKIIYEFFEPYEGN